MKHREQFELGWADRFAARWMQLSAKHPKQTFAYLSILCVIAVVGIFRLGVDADSSKMLSASLPDQVRAAELNEAFPQLKQAIVILVRSTHSDSADLTVAALTSALRNQNNGIHSVYAPAADPFLRTHGFLYRKVDEVDQAMTRLSTSSNLLARLRSDQTLPGFIAALSEAESLARQASLGPEALDRLYAETALVIDSRLKGEVHSFGWSGILAGEAPGGKVTRLITVQPERDLNRLNPVKPALQTIDAAISGLALELHSEVEIWLTGEPVLRAEEMQSVLETIGVSLSLSLILVFLILRIGLGSSARAFLALASLVITLLLTSGFAGFIIGDLNLISIAFIVLMVGLGIDFAIHVLTHIAELRSHGTAIDQSIKLTGQRMGTALVLSAGTTSIAFLAFAVTKFSGMAQLGIIGGAGVLIACAIAMTLLPAVISTFPSLAGPTETLNRSSVIRSRIPSWFATAVVLSLGLASIWPALSVRFDADPMALRDPESRSVRAFHLLAEDPSTTPYRASVLTRSASVADSLTRGFANTEEIGTAISLNDLVPSDQDEKLTLLDIAAPSIEHGVHGDPTDLILRDQDNSGSHLQRFLRTLTQKNDTSETAGSIALARSLQHFIEARTDELTNNIERDLFRAFPLLNQRLIAMLEADYVTEDSIPKAITERFRNSDGVFRIEIVPERDLREPLVLEAFVRAVREIAPDAAGGPMQLYAAGETVGFAMLQATLLAGLATALLVWMATRRLFDVVAILAPLVIAGVFIAAASVALGLHFNYANVIVLPLLIGIGVDSGVHIALRERRAPGAIFETSTPRAVVVSVLTTIAAFGTLALSDHRGTASMGILLTIAMFAAVVCIMALTPTVVRWTRRVG